MGNFTEEAINNPTFTVNDEEIVNPTVPNWMAEVSELTYSINGIQADLPLAISQGGTNDTVRGLALNYTGTELSLGYENSDDTLKLKAGPQLLFENDGYVAFSQGFSMLPSSNDLANQGYNFLLKDSITGYAIRFEQAPNISLIPLHKNNYKNHIETNGFQTDVIMYKISDDYPKFTLTNKIDSTTNNNFLKLEQTAEGVDLSTYQENSATIGVLNLKDTQLKFTTGYVQGLQIGVDIDAAGTDNSTPVTFGSGADYLSLLGQEITQSLIDETSATHFLNPISYGMDNGQVLKSENSGVIPSDKLLMSTGSGVKEASNTAINDVSKQAKIFAMIF